MLVKLYGYVFSDKFYVLVLDFNSMNWHKCQSQRSNQFATLWKKYWGKRIILNFNLCELIFTSKNLKLLFNKDNHVKFIFQNLALIMCHLFMCISAFFQFFFQISCKCDCLALILAYFCVFLFMIKIISSNLQISI